MSESNPKQWRDEAEKPEFEPAGNIDEGNSPEPKHEKAEPLPPIMPVE